MTSVLAITAWRRCGDQSNHDLYTKSSYFKTNDIIKECQPNMNVSFCLKDTNILHSKIRLCDTVAY